MSDVAVKLHNGYINRPYSFFHRKDGRRSTRSRTVLQGYIAPFAVGGKKLHIGYGALAEKLNISRSTVGRNIREMLEEGIIERERKGGRVSGYTYKAEYSSHAPHIRTDNWLRFETFEIFGKKRYLTNIEIDVVSLIDSHTRNEETKCFKGSIHKIAGILGVSEKSVIRAIKALFEAHLISRPKIAWNKHEKSVYKSNVKRFKKEEKKEKKAAKAKAKALEQLPAHVQAANAKAAREKYYSDLREVAEQKHDYWVKKAESNPRFIEVERELKRLNCEISKAEVYRPSDVFFLQQRQTALKAERSALLETQGVEEWMLDVRNHTACRICFDTGILPDGRGCSCYRCQP